MSKIKEVTIWKLYACTPFIVSLYSPRKEFSRGATAASIFPLCKSNKRVSIDSLGIRVSHSFSCPINFLAACSVNVPIGPRYPIFMVSSLGEGLKIFGYREQCSFQEPCFFIVLQYFKVLPW